MRSPRRFALLTFTCVALELTACGGPERPRADVEGRADKPREGGGTAPKQSAPEAVAPAPVAGPSWDWKLPEGLFDPPEVPDDNPMSTEKVDLGHKLFMDKRLSFDASRSCYSCHQNQWGNADGRATALGAGDKALTRNTPTIWNVAYHGALYWDGRAQSLEDQALGAWKGGNMGVGADNIDEKAAEIGALPEYASAFKAAFELGDDARVEPVHVVRALAAYERTLLCGDGPRDAAALRGWDLFRGKASCSTCHNGPAFSDGMFHNVGIGVADGVYADPGRAKVSKLPEDEGKFRTPTLRNVTKTAPYFHDGSVGDLEQAVRYMASGGDPEAPNKDPNLRDVGLNDAEIDDLLAFLGSLECGGELEVIGEQGVPALLE